MVRVFPPLILLLATATVATATGSAWSLRKWQTDDDLPNNTVTGLAQTTDGYLWIASPGPLARFDGIQFEHFTPSRLVPGYHQNARALWTARDGSLWMAMAHGPVFRIKTNNVAEVFTNNLPDAVVQRMLEDPDGGIWLTFPGGLVRRIKDGVVKNFSVADGWPRAFANASLVCDGKGCIWYTKGRDLGKFQDGRFQSLVQLSLPTSVQLAGAREGGVWISTGSELLRYNGGNEPVIVGSFQDQRPNLEATQVFEDHEGGVWIGTSDTGLFYYHPATGFQPVDTSYPQILSILEDREGDIWVGTGGGGLDRIRRSVVRLETVDSGFPFEPVQSICQDRKGVLWATTQNGLLIHQVDDKWSAVSTNEGWAGDMAFCVTADDKGAVWVGARGALYCLKDGQWQAWKRTDQLVSMRIYALLAGRDGDLWVSGAQPDSLQRLHEGQLHTFKLPTDISYIRALAEDMAGNIWGGTARGFLVRVKNDIVTDETTNMFGIPTSVRGICATSDGSVWFGCAGGGLGRLSKDGHFARIMAEQGLVDNYISQIVADDQGWLWFGSDHGIFKTRQDALEEVALGRAARVQCVQYGRSEGLSGLQANFGHWPATLRSRDGRLWMPMRTALAVADPQNGRENFAPPPVVLKRVAMDGQTMAAYGNILPIEAQVNLSQPRASLELPPKHRRLEFDWTALNFSASENVNFRYQLEGFDDHWVDAGPARNAGYSRLPAGNYRFKVQARNGDGEWGEGRSLPIVVPPFVWQTWWFRALALFVFTGSIIAIVRYVSFRRLRSKLSALEQQAAIERERARIARDIHDDLGGSLTQVALLSGLAARDGKDPAKVGEYVQRISSTTHQVIRSLDEVVWAVNPRNDNLKDMIQYIGQFAIELLSAAGIRLHVNFPEKIPTQPVSTEVRHNLFLVTKETLNNITRHAQAREVWLRAKIDGRSFCMTIEDNGQGFPDGTADAFANGVRNMRQRMDEIGGHCEIESIAGKGTRVMLSFSLEE